MLKNILLTKKVIYNKTYFNYTILLLLMENTSIIVVYHCSHLMIERSNVLHEKDPMILNNDVFSKNCA